MRSFYRLILPLLIFLSLCCLFMVILLRDERNNIIPSPLINSVIPSFSVSSLEFPNQSITEKDLIGQPALINIWATWCDACIIEHNYLVHLAKNNIRIFGINYKDERMFALKWLKERGNPYLKTLFDESGDLGMLFGIFGAPETFLIDSKGIIKYRHVGIIETQVWENKISPEYQKLFHETRLQ